MKENQNEMHDRSLQDEMKEQPTNVGSQDRIQQMGGMTDEMEENRQESNEKGQSQPVQDGEGAGQKSVSLQEESEANGQDSQHEEKDSAQEGKLSAEDDGAVGVADEKAEPFAQKEAGDAQEKEQADQAKDVRSQAEIPVNPPKAPQYASSYAPPYYVPNFTVYGAANEAPVKKKKHSGGTIALIAVLVAVAVLLSATVGCFAGVVMAMMQGTPEETDGTKAPMSGNDNVSVNQNANIVVNQTTPSADGNLSVADVVELVADSVVEITTTYRDSDGSLVSGAGSGVLVGENQNYGYLITNFHVAGSYAESIAVRLTNEEIYDADYVTGDQASDLAIVRIAKKNGESFTVATLVENCDGLRKGDDVIAIGNPLAMLPGTVTEGIISNKSVTLMVDGFVMDLYQVSAAVNPGNSGGGLFNRAGQLVGIVNAKVSAEGVEGLAFAIPGDYVNRFVMDALDDGDVTGKPTIGVSAVYSSLYGQVGMFVASTTTSAVQVNDRICSINGVTITNESDYMEAMHALENGQTITVVMERGTFYFPNRVSWSEYSITVTVGEYNTND